jgi:Polyketide cyclase / dehydrase and lipid transport
MSSWKQQALVEAPVEDVWDLLADPARFPEWNQNTIDVTGVPTTIEKGSTYRETSRGSLGLKLTTEFKVEEMNELREIKMRCQTSGYYSHWLLTEARGSTFIDVEVGVEPHNLKSRLFGTTITKGFVRRAAEDTLDGLRRFLQRTDRQSAEPST